MGMLMSVLVSTYMRSFDSTSFDTQYFYRSMGLCAIFYIIHNVVHFLVGKALPSQSLLETIATTGYEFVYAGVAGLFKRAPKVVFIPVLCYAGVAAFFHGVQIEIIRIKAAAEQNLSSAAQIQAQNIVALGLGALEAAMVVAIALFAL